jgi:hypothetical protein
LRSLIRALAGSVNSYRDGEYNFGITGPAKTTRRPGAHAPRTGRRAARAAPGLVQRELLLDTMVQNTPVAMLLIAPGGDGMRRVVFANLAARKLLHGGWKLEGQRFDELLAGAGRNCAKRCPRRRQPVRGRPRSRSRRRRRRRRLSPLAPAIPSQRPRTTCC